MSTQSTSQTQDGPTGAAWLEWVSLMGYAGVVALAVSCALGVAVVLVGGGV